MRCKQFHDFGGGVDERLLLKDLPNGELNEASKQCGVGQISLHR